MRERALPRVGWPAALLAALLALPLAVRSPYYLHLACLVTLWATLAQAWNLLGGFAGQVSFGHAAFFGTGVYAAGILAVRTGLSPWWGLPLAALLAGILAVGLGSVCFRLRGPYFSLSMLALSQVLRVVATNLPGLTGGAQGLLVVPAWPSPVPFYYSGAALAATAYVTCRAFLASRWGLFALAVREDEDAAAGVGVPVLATKNLALVLSGVLTGLAGAYYLAYFGYAEPGIVFSLPEVSIAVVLVTVLGGVATLSGPLLGAVAMVLSDELARRALGRAHSLFFGLMVILVIRFFPRGLVALKGGALARDRRRPRER